MVSAATAMSETDFAEWLEPFGVDQEQVRKRIEMGQAELERQKAELEGQKAYDAVLEAAAKASAERHQMQNELINAGYRALATKYHPDTGGSHDKMVHLNRLRDDLKR